MPAAVVTVASCVALLAGCASGGGAETLNGAPSKDATPPAPAGLAAPSVAGPDADFVLRAYAGYWAAQVRAMSTGQADGSDLSTYATSEALSDSYADLVRLDGDGMRMRGAPVSHPKVTSVGAMSGAKGIDQATVVDCLDVTGWHQVLGSNGRIADPARRLTRYQVVATARTVGGVWMITQITRETDKPC
ncbi:hypothetical protein [Streptacidiphilus fuscans]|uniref:Secreted protein/lipoprotein n=1 Tax=Streptacidiphilus fuscans TaxID=2789292 RepID=A0A931B0B2_9ACTN|nr:hypothetical protein [Streptacidiphilus fuscans]MBF9066586.1 hypothetical protein [Streptacidiphilus fuscans]